MMARRCRRVAAGLGSTAVFLLAAAPAYAQTGTGSRFEFSRDSQRVVLTYVEYPGELADPEAAPHLEIYGDGRAVAHFPQTMKRAGDFQVSLDEAELTALLGGVVERELVDFDADAVRNRRRALASQRRASQSIALFSVSDPSVVEISVHLERYRPAQPGAADRTGVSKRIRYRNLRADARNYPELREVQELKWARDRLRELLQRPDLARVTR